MSKILDMWYEDRFKSVSNNCYNHLMLDDYLLIGCGSYRKNKMRDVSNVQGRKRAVDHYATEFSKKFRVSKKKLCMYFNDEVGTSKNYELSHGHNHIAISRYHCDKVDPVEAVKFSDRFWRDNYGICTFERFDNRRKRCGISYLSKHKQNGLLVMNNVEVTKAMYNHLDYLFKNKSKNVLPPHSY